MAAGHLGTAAARHGDLQVVGVHHWNQVDQSDAVGERRRPNMPGTTDRPNWSLPLPVPVEDLPGHPLVQTVAQEVRARIQENLFEMVKKRKSVWFG